MVAFDGTRELIFCEVSKTERLPKTLCQICSIRWLESKHFRSFISKLICFNSDNLIETFHVIEQKAKINKNFLSVKTVCHCNFFLNQLARLTGEKARPQVSSMRCEFI